MKKEKVSRISKYQLLALDIDGTLVNTQDEISPETIAALKEAQAAGIKLALATGRRYSRTISHISPLGIDAPIVTSSGALIKQPSNHETLYKANFAPGVLEKILQVIRKIGYEPILYADTYLDGFDYYCLRAESDQPELDEFLKMNFGSEKVDPDLWEAPLDNIIAGFVMGTQKQMEDLADQLEVSCPGELYLHVIRSPRYLGFMCEIAPKNNTKWTGICHIAKQYGITSEAICAVGDDVNDIPMIENAGLGVAMGNALPAVKLVADRIAPNQDEDGLVEVVKWLLSE